MSATANQDNATRRLIDITVEEVSLVDRAANKRKFLIVKRSDSMNENDTNTNPAETTPISDDGVEIEVTSFPENNIPPDTGMLQTALDALEKLTFAVESLGSVQETGARVKIEELASELSDIAERLSDATRADHSASADPEDSAQDTSSSGLDQLIESVRATLRQVGSLIDGAKGKTQDKPAKDPAAESNGQTGSPVTTPASGVAQTTALEKTLAGLNQSLTALNDSFKGLQLRLSKLEKGFGLPNSQLKERTQKQTPETVSWPLDLNKPMDRANVDKAVSFHDPS